MNHTIPRYYEIAVDFAKKIMDGEYNQGDKVYARTTLATHYGTSPETARRAMSVLADLGIVDATRGSGVLIISAQKAADFIRQHGTSISLLDMKTRIQEILASQSAQMSVLAEQMDDFMEKAQKFHTANPLSPYMIELSEQSPMLGKSIAQTHFWQNTGATIVAIRREEDMILSPGPHAAF
ncbi:MAG: GntR family transcriptional regulator, partial [Clostridiales bacterium]|nr:GntR family transcriptional regulator [Clostridiales bacterium]